nr:allene oxide synthase 3-like [Ipomoea batatas]
MSSAPLMSSSSLDPALADNLPVVDIPGSYGLPFLGPILDRYDYFYNQGEVEFFQSRKDKYQSTVFRSNMPPGPFMAKNSKVIVLLDNTSFPILFDVSKVEKKDLFEGTYMASTKFTGGYRMCAFLDPSEPKHAALKGFFLATLAKLKDKVIPQFTTVYSDLFTSLEEQVKQSGQSSFNDLNDNKAMEFLFRLYCNGKSPADTKLGATASKTFDLWLVPQLAPLITLGFTWLPNFIEDLALHTFPIPFCIVKSAYDKIYDSFYDNLGSILDDAESAGLQRDEACHNIIFLNGFNSYGGFKVFFPALFKWIGAAGPSLHAQLATEIRAAVAAEGDLTVAALEKMPLTKSVVWEALRIEPPVAFQYGKAKEDLIVRSSDNKFYIIKKDEMIFGYQPFATKDELVFADAEKFVPDRFVGSDGEKLVQNVYWSNGRETDSPTVNDKQCPGKDLVVLLSRLVVAQFFLRYDSFTCEAEKFLLGSKTTFTSLTKATSAK